MLKHGRAGVPMEVMGLMLGECVDDYTIKVVDVFAMPQRYYYYSLPSQSSYPECGGGVVELQFL